MAVNGPLASLSSLFNNKAEVSSLRFQHFQCLDRSAVGLSSPGDKWVLSIPLKQPLRTNNRCRLNKCCTSFYGVTGNILRHAYFPTKTAVETVTTPLEKNFAYRYCLKSTQINSGFACTKVQYF